MTRKTFLQLSAAALLRGAERTTFRHHVDGFNRMVKEEVVNFIPDSDAWAFRAPFGPTTAERRNPEFAIPYEGDDCQWNGPSWPFATAITLRALANVLNDYRQDAISRKDYFETFLTTRDHSTYCDLVITVLVGLRPRADRVIEINPADS